MLRSYIRSHKFGGERSIRSWRNGVWTASATSIGILESGFYASSRYGEGERTMSNDVTALVSAEERCVFPTSFCTVDVVGAKVEGDAKCTT